MKKILLLFTLICTMLIAFTTLQEIVFKAPPNWPKPIYDFTKNPLAAEKIELGRALFYDPILSVDNTISCASCHSSYSAFTHVDHALSHGIENRIGIRNAPALMNLAWQNNFMWDGAIENLDKQSVFPITHPDEMGEKMEHLAGKLQASELYPSLFYKAFGDSIISSEHILKSIAQFMLTIVSANAKYDSVMRKQTEFNAQEKNGYRLFQQNCASCHKEPLFTNLQFENNGLPVDTTLNDYGRMKVTKDSRDSLRFKVPTLRNIEFSYPYMHDGRFKKLSEVLKHYTTGVRQNKTLSKPLLNPIVLTSDERIDLIAFLLTLTDKTFLFNQQYAYPKHIFFPTAKE